MFSLANNTNLTKLDNKEDLIVKNELKLDDLNQFPELPNKKFNSTKNLPLLNNGTNLVINFIFN